MTRLNFRYARDNNAMSYCPFKVDSLNDEIEALRSRLPDVPYNKDWTGLSLTVLRRLTKVPASRPRTSQNEIIG